MFHRSVKCPAGSLSFGLATILSRWYISCVCLFPKIQPKSTLRINVHRLQHRLQGSLIPFAPYAFAVQRQFLIKLSLDLPDPVYRLHLRSSDFDHPISLVPKSFRIPLSDSSDSVTLTFLTPYWIAFTQVVQITAYLPFTPSPDEQHLPPLYDRVCWHNH